MEPNFDRRRKLLFLTIIVFIFFLSLLIFDILIYIVELGANPSIRAVSDTFRLIETTFRLVGEEQAIYPVTSIGHGLSMGLLGFTAILLIVFGAQVFSLMQTFTLRRQPRSDEQVISAGSVINPAVNLERETERLNQQPSSIEYEENIMEKLDRLRNISTDEKRKL
ncbi:TPA: hypothetical protein DF272_01120 [Candidatus Falkowbacteria bacterium]|nr:hypothetical protein [Candidatus Falkowbacteria bacterium]